MVKPKILKKIFFLKLIIFLAYLFYYFTNNYRNDYIKLDLNSDWPIRVKYILNPKYSICENKNGKEVLVVAFIPTSPINFEQRNFLRNR